MIAGDIIEASFNHPTVGSGVVYPKAGEAGTLDLGGFTSEDNAQGIDGGGRMIDKMTRKRPFFTMNTAWDNNNTDELQKMQDLQNSTVPADWTLTHISGAIYGIKGKPVGDINGNFDSATFSLKIAGVGSAKKIA